ncbi:hypothetical protein ZWY2020_057320 [Hordeum vulgare]|nr:hypothetical protein ZWY2020_057320 [Hordeum vulgare]
MEAAIGAANGLIGTVLSHLSSEFLEAYVASSQLGLNSKKIKEDLMFTQGLLHEAQRRGMGDNPGLQGLLQNLTIKADEAEDALDELHYFIIQDHLDGTHYAVPDLGDNIRGHAQHGRHALRHTIGNCIACFSFSCMKDGDGGAATDAITNSPHNSVRNNRSGGNDGPVDKLSFDRVAMSKKIKWLKPAPLLGHFICIILFAQVMKPFNLLLLRSASGQDVSMQMILSSG